MTFMLFLVQLEKVGLLSAKARVSATSHALSLHMWSYPILENRLRMKYVPLRVVDSR
jgi:hypothetical protein